MNGQINRAAQLWQNWEEKEKMLLEVFGHGQLFENLNKQRYDFLSRGVDRISKDVTPDEKLVLGLIKKSTRRLEKELYPHPLWRIARRIKAFVYDRPVQAAKGKKALAENMQSLTTAFNKIGLSTEKVNLEQHLGSEKPKVEIELISPWGTSNYAVKVHLEKDLFGKMGIPSYTGTLKDPFNPEKSRSYTFDTKLGIDARAAANLLQGRAVLSYYPIEGNRMASKWLQLDFNKPSANGQPVLKEISADYDYNIRREVAKVADMLNKPELATVRVLNGMEQGNQIALKQVTGETTYLEADPLGKSIILRDADGKKTMLQAVLLERKKDQGPMQEIKLTKSRTKEKTMGQSIGMA